MNLNRVHTKQIKWKDALYFLKFLIPYYDKQLLILILIVIVSILGLVNPLLTKVLIDTVYPARDLSLLRLLILIWVFIYFLNAISGWVNEFLGAYLTLKIQFDLRKLFLKHIQKLPFPYYCKKKPGDYFYGSTKDIDNIVNMIRTSFPRIIQSLLNFSFLLCLTLWLNWKLTLISLAIIPFIQKTTQISSAKLQELEIKKRNRDSEIISTIQENISSYKLIKIFNSWRYELKKIVKKMITLFHLEMRKTRVLALFSTSQGFIQSFWAISITWYGWTEVIKGNLSMGELIAITMYLFQLHGPIRAIAGIYQQLKMQSVSCNRVLSILEIQPTNTKTPDIIVKKNTVKGEIKFENVSFEYRKNEPVLRNISFVIPPNSKTALVGPNGTGKTTIIDLILRLIKPTHGRIYIDDIKIEDISENSFSKLVGVVPQESYIFSDTIKENVIYNCHRAGEKDIMYAAEIACAHEFIEALPLKFDTILTSGRVILSGGEKQKIELMRAIIRKPQILILDEATSAIDSKTERRIFRNLKEAFPEMTLIIISHRFSTIPEADNILVLSQGKLVELGKHFELLSQKGIYYKMYKKELRKYEEDTYATHVI